MKRFNKLISVLFHPILFPVISTIVFFILKKNTINSKEQLQIISIVSITTYFIPVVILFISKKFNLIDSIEIRKINHQKVALIFMSIILYLLGKSLHEVSELTNLSKFFLGGSLALACTYMFLLRKIKVSIHIVSITSFLCFIIQYSIQTKTNLTTLLAIIILATGVISNARIKLKDNTLKETYIGLALGVSSQLIVFILPYLRF